MAAIVKPSVFFSHASVDAVAIAALKKRFIEITGGSIDVFVSSDGQSIRFGRNWVHEIEEALARCKIMFVFVTPRSMSSGWIFFEAGHAYGRDIHVVPVAFLGADLEALPGPLALLQGFNVRDAAGLDNLVAIVNREFLHTHSAKFSAEDYADIDAGSVSAHTSFCAPYTHLIDTIRIEVDLLNASFAVVQHPDLSTVEKVRKAQAAEESTMDRARNLAAEHLKARGIVFFEERGSLHSAGLTVEPGGGRTINIEVEAGAARTLVHVAESIARILKPNDPPRLDLWFSKAVSGEAASHRVTGRLILDGVAIDAEAKQRSSSRVPPLSWRGRAFQFGSGSGGNRARPPMFVSTTAEPDFDLEWTEALVKLLFARGILFLE